MSLNNSSDEDDTIDPYDDYDAYASTDFFTETTAGPSTFSEYSTNEKTEAYEDSDFIEAESLDYLGVERVVNESIEKICAVVPVTPSLAKILLHSYKWNIGAITDGYQMDRAEFLSKAKLCNPMESVKLDSHADAKIHAISRVLPDSKILPFVDSDHLDFCPVCLAHADSKNFMRLSCSHGFCKFCWRMHFKVQIDAGISTAMECMNDSCNVLVPEDFVSEILLSCPNLRARYSNLASQDLVKSNPEFRFCVGPDCTQIIWCKKPQAKRVTCQKCRSSYCFLCGSNYHAPTTCEVIKKWLTKCCDDSETANYLTANTKDCPHCGVCIEKNGGCNHIFCSKCKQHFCWMCGKDWKTHGSEYYECSKYKENPNVSLSLARKSLQKYLFYFQRWENHEKSLKMEKSMMEKIKDRIDDKLGKHHGTWIDWQYLYNAAALLTKCRYTLQYTYPFAYYMPTNHRKHLFEYQQAQLESEIENLAWKVEHAEATDKGDLQRQMHVAELKRQTLLKDFCQ